MIIMEAHGVASEGVVSRYQARIYDDRFIKDIRRAASAIRDEGSIPAIQIHHAGRQVSSRVINRKPFAPSPLPCPAIKGDVEPLTHDGIKKITMQFGDAAERAVDAGFDLIEIHGAHGYLINQFLSGYSNIRKDEYGGTIENRARFAVDIVREIRDRIGSKFPLSFKISAQEFVPGGLTTDESIEILKILVNEGIDIVQVSAGNDASPEWISPPMFMEQACFAGSAARIRREVGVPVMAVGRINDPFIAEKILKDEMADLICMGRGLLADPRLPEKARAGRFDDIRKCIACNTCIQSIFKTGKIECLVNPSLGREKELAFLPAENPRKIMVIGGGPGGLSAAKAASQRGHHVEIFEKDRKAGGQLRTGGIPGFKKDLNKLIDYLIKQVEKENIKCHFGHKVTVETVKKFNPDAVILAAGSIPGIPSIKGADGPNVVTVHECLLNDRVYSKGKNIVVCGGGPSGCEVALYLSESGHKVTLIEMLPKAGMGMEAMTKKILINRMKKSDVRVLTECTVTEIMQDRVIYKAGESDETINCDIVVLATGNIPNDILFGEIESLGINIFKIGDCNKVGGAKEAIFEGASTGNMV